VLKKGKGTPLAVAMAKNNTNNIDSNSTPIMANPVDSASAKVEFAGTGNHCLDKMQW
jgi:hypothetical protein